MGMRCKKLWSDRAQLYNTVLRQWAQRQGYSYTVVADLTGVSASQLYRLMHGTCVPSLVSALRIEHVTSGAVPVESWLELPLAKMEWQALEKSDAGQKALEYKAERQRLRARAAAAAYREQLPK